jgi:ATP citrate (pro-S)-lyase
MDYNAAVKAGLVRKPTNFISTISDDRGEELIYGKMTISEVFEKDIGIGGVLSILWFKKLLPDYATKFIEMAIMVTADHGPAVSGAHNTIVATRAGKDLISSMVSGMLTIGPRFGGAVDGAAQMFSDAFDSGKTPSQFVNEMKLKGVNIQGIGHRIKSIHNPDMRVEIISSYAKKHFKATPLLDYAREVEKITTSKRDNLILNVDGCIGICFADLLRNEMPKQEADDYIKMGALNGLFVLGRSIGLIGHYLDQKRLKQGLYRHPWDDIAYMLDK